MAGESVAKIAQDRGRPAHRRGGARRAAPGGDLRRDRFVVGLRASAPIEQIRRRQAEFTADASHELRTPLSVIEAEVDLALSGTSAAPTGYRDTLRGSASESGRLRTIVEDLLWLARADGDRPGDTAGKVADVAGRRRHVPRPVPGRGRRRVGDTVRPHRAGHGPDRCRPTPTSIDRLITVLLDNACKYAGDQAGSRRARGSGPAGRVVLTVDDSGPGIPEEDRDLVFDRFHRADELPGGTGLGLAIADAVVRNSWGTWSIGTSPLGGARCRCRGAGGPRGRHTVARRRHQPGPEPAGREPLSLGLFPVGYSHDLVHGAVRIAPYPSFHEHLRRRTAGP